MVNDILEVDIGFFALVHLNGVFGVGLIDHVDCVLPSGNVGITLVRIVLIGYSPPGFTHSGSSSSNHDESSHDIRPKTIMRSDFGVTFGFGGDEEVGLDLSLFLCR